MLTLLKLMYVIDGKIHDTQMWKDPETDYFWDWINLMVQENPDVNFFFVTVTTDITEVFDAKPSSDQ